MTQQVQSINRARDGAQRTFSRFDYRAPAELFPSRIKKGKSRIAYRRFNTAAEAVKFAIEEIPASALIGAYLEVNEARFSDQEIRRLYDADDYPLKKRAA